MSNEPVTGSAHARGLLFIVSAPSGAGKTTLVERLVEQLPNLRMSRSYTSRPARQSRQLRPYLLSVTCRLIFLHSPHLHLREFRNNLQFFELSLSTFKKQSSIVHKQSFATGRGFTVPFP